MVPLALEAMMTEHEADRTTSLIMDAAEGRACIAMGDILARLGEILRGLSLDPKRMRANLDLGHGLIMAEAVMLDLGKAIGRQHAHDVVYDAGGVRGGKVVFRSVDGGRPGLLAYGCGGDAGFA
jgi:adenylosuccinate lyase